MFEDVLPKGTGAIGEIKEKLQIISALGTAMTGRASAVFGIFQDEKTAASAYEFLKASYNECYLTEPTGRIEIA